MLRIRLSRVGKKKQPSYRIVVVDSRAPRDGAYLDLVGSYNPLPKEPVVRIDEEKARGWLLKGAQPSEPVVRLLRKSGVLEKADNNEGAD
jgi:small subunit ribosomal protein S16